MLLSTTTSTCFCSYCFYNCICNLLSADTANGCFYCVLILRAIAFFRQRFSFSPTKDFLCTRFSCQLTISFASFYAASFYAFRLKLLFRHGCISSWKHLTFLTFSRCSLFYPSCVFSSFAIAHQVGISIMLYLRLLLPPTQSFAHFMRFEKATAAFFYAYPQLLFRNLYADSCITALYPLTARFVFWFSCITAIYPPSVLLA